ncbi:MAG: proton-conducting transporter membrane subunit [Elusimicrobia bacterium]|nr:proton-conducting transporter membrane subunit [Elusimicrobiota bacterium]
MIALFILIPLVSVLILNLCHCDFVKKIACWFGMLLTLVQIYFVLFVPIDILNNQSALFGTNFAFNLTIDSLSKLMLLAIGIVVFSAIMIGQFTYHDEDQKFNFANLIMLTLAGMNGVVMVTDIFSLYVFIEIVAVSSFILISIYKDKAALESAFKYIVLSVTATLFILLSISIFMLISGDTSFIAINNATKNSAGSLKITIAICLFICGAFTKGGLVPFHSWLPDAHSSAPTSISILLSGIVIKVSGIYPLIRILSITGGGGDQVKNILLFIGAVSIVVGALAALGQSDIKRMLAFSSVSQMGYIVLSLGTGTVLGLAGAVFHMLNHAIFKSQLFANSAAVEKQTGTRNMDKLGGLATKMPITGGSSIVAMLSISGIPPLSGFWSKLLIIIALWQSAHYSYAFIAVISSVITLAYFLSLQRKVFFGKVAPGLENVKEAKLGLVLPVIILALLTIFIGIFFPLVLNKLILPIESILK